MWKWAVLLAPVAFALDVEWNSPDSVKDGLSVIAKDMMSIYVGDEYGEVPGILPGGLQCDPSKDNNYCWWMAGAMFGSLINYWQYTGDETYVNTTVQAILHQRGEKDNFNPRNHSSSMGIDDQAFWAFTALDAVEANFPESPNEDDPSYLSLAQGLFNFQLDYWDTKTCGGGFRWQVVSLNSGYHLKNMISNGGNFQVAARLAYITGNDTYADWADMVWDWMASSMMFERDGQGLLYIWDNVHADLNCTDPVNYIWSYNYGVILAGAAYMYNFTDGSEVWKGRVEELLSSALQLYFPQEDGNGNIMIEFLCEREQSCNQDQKSFKAYLTRWLAVTAILVPETWDRIMPKLMTSAQAAAQQCGTGDGTWCSSQWWTNVPTGKTGAGEQMAALSAVGATLLQRNMAPLSFATGATSESKPNPEATEQNTDFKPITTGDKAGAAILTILICAAFIGSMVWIVLE